MVVALTLYVIGIVLFPFYVFDSGLPQPAHLVFFGAAILAIFTYRDSLQALRSRLIRALASFVLYAVAVNTLVGLYFGSAESSVYSVYYVFNGVVLTGLICLGINATDQKRAETFWNAIFFATLFGLFVQTTIGLLDVGRPSYRAILFFNNPNQLGYFSVAVASIIFISQRAGGGSQGWSVVGYVMAIYLAALSLSKAAFISILVIPLVHVLSGKGASYSRIFVVGIAFSAIAVGAAFVGDDVVDNMKHRLSTIGKQGDDSLEGRAYDRLWKFPKYLMFGAGEGFREERFASHWEIHSLPATLLFSYGIVGFFLFSQFLWLVYRRVGNIPFLQLLPVCLYNLTHNGFRSPLFWFVIGLMFLGAVSSKNTSRPKIKRGRMNSKPVFHATNS